MTLSLASVNLVPDGAIGPLCPGESATFVCNTTADLLWETSSAPGGNHRIFLASQSPATLGVFILSVNSVSVMSGMVSSTATTVNGVRPSDDGVTLVCFENTDLTMFEQAVLRVEGKFCLSMSCTPQPHTTVKYIYINNRRCICMVPALLRHVQIIIIL